MASLSATAPAAAVDTSASHPYTCNSCQVAFRNSELQRAHMRSDWHRYNLKRRVTSLPPISSETFTEKVLQAQAASSESASKAFFEKVCGPCERTYSSENAYINHINSQKHKMKLASVAETRDDASSTVMSSTFSLADPAEMLDPNAEEEFNEVVEGINKANLKDIPEATGRPARPHPVASEDAGESSSSTAKVEDEEMKEPSLTSCLFCNYESPDVKLNAAHMERIHGMFIPERDYLVDLDGLIGSLYQTINEFHECLYCHKLKPSIFGLQTHMRDKGHCKIPFETEDEQLEIGEFYDFRSTYSDVDDESDSEDAVPDKKMRRSAKLGGKRKAKTDEDGDEGMEEGDGWETDSSASSLDSADLTAVPLEERTHQYEKLDQHRHHTSTDPRPHHNKDGYHSHAHKHAHAVFYSEYELHLPSGRTAGHRSLNKYFRQNLHSHPSPAERQAQQQLLDERHDSDAEEERELTPREKRDRGRAIVARGRTGMVGVTEEKRREVADLHKRSQKADARAQRNFAWGVNKKGNSQKHFRDPLLQ